MAKSIISTSVRRYLAINLLIIAFAVFLNYYLYTTEKAFLETAASSEIEDIRRTVNEHILLAQTGTESMRSFFESSENVSPEEFENYAKILTTSLASGGLQVQLEWIDENNIIKYAYPDEKGSSSIVGLDLNLYPNRLIPINEAKVKKGMIVSRPIMLVEGYPGFILYNPIYKNEKYGGAVLSVIRATDLFKIKTTTYVKNSHANINGYILPLDQDVIYSPTGQKIIDASDTTINDPEIKKYIDGEENQKILLSVAGDNWQLAFTTLVTEMALSESSVFIIASILFLVVTLLILYRLYRVEKISAKAEAQTKALLSSIAEGIIACDKAGVVTFVNEAALNIIEEKEKENILGKELYEIWPAVDEKGNIIRLDKRPYHITLATGKVTSSSLYSKYFYERKDGTRFPVASVASPIIVNKKIAGAIVVFRDISKELEVDRMKTEFLSLASHQLLTPIAAINWMTEILLDGDAGKLNADQTSRLTDIKHSARRMGDLVTSLLNVSRIESGRLTVAPEPTKIKDLVDQMVKEVKMKADKKKQNLKVNIAEIPIINIDPRLISEVYKNLLTNAIKYTPEGGEIIVDVSLNKKDIVSKVIDTGYGIPESDQGKIFQKFYRASNVIQSEPDGNGLGLYLLKQIVEVSGGSVGFESKPGKGTTFWFKLPVAGSKAHKGEVGIS